MECEDDARPRAGRADGARPQAGYETGLPGSDGEHRLQREYGTQERAERFYAQQVLDRLNEHMREFVGRQELMFVATADRHGECDCTLRAGPPGFVRVIDEGRVAWPEYRGNGVMASVGNVAENPHVGLLFVDFCEDLIGLHVNGLAEVVDDETMRREHPTLPPDPAPGRRPERWILVRVDEAYIHCGKHIPRMRRVPRERAWGTDDVRRKGGDFFRAAGEPRPWVPAEPAGAPGVAPGEVPSPVAVSPAPGSPVAVSAALASPTVASPGLAPGSEMALGEGRCA